MNHTNRKTATRSVSGFDQVSIRGNTCSARLLINQGEREQLTIEAPTEYLNRIRSEVRHGKLTIRLTGSWLQELKDALATSFERPTIIYRLEVRELTALDVQCVYFVHCAQAESPKLRIKLNGIGSFRLEHLLAESLQVQHSGSGSLQIAGQVEKQTVILSGIGNYCAPELASQDAHIRMSGTGSARVQVSHTLDANLRGVGVLEYIGNPAVSQQISGPGQIRRVAGARTRTA